MSTLVAEQTREIGIIRAIGARRRQVAAVYLRTTLLLGGIAAVVGAALGVLLSSLLARYFGSLFWVVDVGFGVDPPVLAVSLLVGLLAPALAALPAVRRCLRVDLGRPGPAARPSAARGRLPGAAAGLVHAPHDADRAAQRRAAQATEPGHRLDRRPRRREPARRPRRGRGRHRGHPPIVEQPPRGPPGVDQWAGPPRRRGRTGDPHHPRSRRGRARAQEHGGAERRGGLRLGHRAGATPRLPAGRRPLVHRCRRAGRGAGRRRGAQHRPAPRHRGRRRRVDRSARPAPPTSVSSAWPTTSRRRGPRSTSP